MEQARGWVTLGLAGWARVKYVSTNGIFQLSEKRRELQLTTQLFNCGVTLHMRKIIFKKRVRSLSN